LPLHLVRAAPAVCTTQNVSVGLVQRRRLLVGRNKFCEAHGCELVLDPLDSRLRPSLRQLGCGSGRGAGQVEEKGGCEPSEDVELVSRGAPLRTKPV